MSEEVLQKAFASTEAVLLNVKADQLDNPTPCASWTVRDLINHVVGGASYFAVIAETGQAPSGGDAPADVADGDFNTAFQDGARKAVAAFRADGVMDKLL